MSQRAQALADQFEQTNARVIAAVESIPEAKWHARCDADGRSINVVAHHIAGSTHVLTTLLQLAATGQGLPPITRDGIHERNAMHAAKHENCTREETLALLHANGSTALATIRGLSDEQLGIPVGYFGPAEGLIERIIIGHAESHLTEIQAAISA